MKNDERKDKNPSARTVAPTDGKKDDRKRSDEDRGSALGAALDENLSVLGARDEATRTESTPGEGANQAGFIKPGANERR